MLDHLVNIMIGLIMLVKFVPDFLQLIDIVDFLLCTFELPTGLLLTGLSFRFR